MAEQTQHTPLSPLAQRQVSQVPFSRPATPESHNRVQIGWIGLGSMGYLMARNLARHRATHLEHQPPLLVWNRSREKSENLLKELGESAVTIAQSAAEVAIKCDIVISSLANDGVVKSTYQDIAVALKAQPPAKHKIFVEASTIYPSVAGELDALISAIPHCHLVTSPVFGPPLLADKAGLVVALSGDYNSKKEVAYVLVPAIGRRALDLGNNLEKAPTFKLIGNSLILSSLEIIAEAYTMAEKSGVGQALVYELIKELMPSPLWLSYGDRMLKGNFNGNGGFSIDGGVKDATHIRHLTAEHNSPMPVVDATYNHLLAARAIHQAQARTGSTEFPVLDWSALIAGTRVAAGLDAFDGSKACPRTVPLRTSR
ncbi:NAD-P-binding protein [Gloeopeniophorella convolvens]|nr:NAD-P-binding protein [Gloeopeniophorella convolvens]